MKATTSMRRNNESGNAFLIILLGVVLFGALAFTMSRSMRSTTTETLSARDADLAASDIMNYAQEVERAVSKLRGKGISENDLSFENTVVTSGYAHTPAVPVTSRIFHTSGANLSWRSPPPNANDGSEWHFTGSSCVINLGTGGAGCDSDGISNEELLAVLYYVNHAVCEQINKKLGIGAIPVNSAEDGPSETKFTGALQGDTPIDFGAARSTACIEGDKNGDDVPDYHFYHALIVR